MVIHDEVRQFSNQLFLSRCGLMTQVLPGHGNHVCFKHFYSVLYCLL